MTHAIDIILKPLFSHYLPVQRGLSSNTIASYRDAIKLLLIYVADQLKKTVDRLDIRISQQCQYLAFLTI